MLIQEETGPHYLESNWQCGECGELFIVKTYLKEHIDNVHKANIYQCRECEKTYCDETNLKEHTENSHAQDNTNKERAALRRRHEALKEKYDETIKKNKLRTYCQNPNPNTTQHNGWV